MHVLQFAHTMLWVRAIVCDPRKSNIERGLPKKGGAWTICRFKGGLVKNKWGGVFEGV